MARSFILYSALLAMKVAAQTSSPYTDAKTGISFNGFKHASGYTFGIALPETPTTDFIGQIVAPVGTAGGWAGFTMGQSMSGSLAVVAWPNGDEVVSSFRKASGYTSPPVTTGDFTMTPIPSGTFINDTAFSYTFLCSKCLGTNGLVLSATTNVLGWAYSTDAITTPASASSALTYHAAGFGGFGLTVADAKSANYATWAAMAVASNSTTTPGGNSTTPVGGGSSTNTTATVSNSTYDYIVAGAGAAGIIVAERLVESGASVLLLERGGSSLAFTGNDATLPWNSSVTMYDVPGVDYYLSTVGSPAYCTDTADQAGCLLGGGTMVNAMMFVRPQARDFDAKWPAGWKWADVSAAADRLYERNPGQTYGSVDGVRHNNEAFEVVSQFLLGNGWSHTDAIEKPNDKIDAFSYPPWSLKDGLRSGPVRTYLPLAQAKSNFKLMLDTKVIRAVRSGSTISGVETETSTGERVIYNVKAGGRVVLASGSMSTPRILFNSGIGPAAQIQTVADGTSSVTLPDKADWIDLPVGAEIKDHPIFTLKFKTSVAMPSLATSQFTSPNDTSSDLFAQGSGILAQSGQRLSFWTSVNTTSGKEVFIQGTCNGPANNTVQMKIYLTHGLTSTGSLGITADGATELTSDPWLKTDDDIEAATMFMDRLLTMTRQPNSTLTFLSAGDVTGSNVTGTDLIKNHVTGAHYVGTAKMGTKGDAGVVVDTDTKVYGTDNLFVVDASMHPDLPTGNTQAIVMVAAEAAAARILALPTTSTANTTTTDPTTPTSSILPVGTDLAVTSALPSGTGIAAPISSSADVSSTVSPLASSGAAVSSVAPAVSSEAPAPSSPSEATPSPSPATTTTQAIPTATPSPASGTIGQYGRCGGLGYEGTGACANGWVCKKQNEYYSQCVAPSKKRHVPKGPDSIQDEDRTWERASFLDLY
ncbi:carbohydrate-binding module family 1 protein [Pleomassaria siparia CBS 279.74]|uniref:Carbohydrate-binding module family 1 protein n=1 Tax=Pleomassaria siparia CBS 279.74 TaxID=1314801 RepID=A0A6G1KKY8_9PLEO|nr:carbohydrate-binding module family 1 protein [Pleomassaria siparia CBS 279.74]